MKKKSYDDLQKLIAKQKEQTKRLEKEAREKKKSESDVLTRRVGKACIAAFPNYKLSELSEDDLTRFLKKVGQVYMQSTAKPQQATAPVSPQVAKVVQSQTEHQPVKQTVPMQQQGMSVAGSQQTSTVHQNAQVRMAGMTPPQQQNSVPNAHL